MKFCPNCGNQVDDNQKFCPNCGTEQIQVMVGGFDAADVEPADTVPNTFEPEPFEPTAPAEDYTFTAPEEPQPAAPEQNFGYGQEQNYGYGQEQGYTTTTNYNAQTPQPTFNADPSTQYNGYSYGSGNDTANQGSYYAGDTNTNPTGTNTSFNQYSNPNVQYGAGAPTKKGSGKTIFIIIAILIVAVIVGIASIFIKGRGSSGGSTGGGGTSTGGSSNSGGSGGLNFGNGGNSGGNSGGGDSSSSGAGTILDEGDLLDYHVAIGDAYMDTSYEGEDCFVVLITFTNNSNEDIAPITALYIDVYQGDESMDYTLPESGSPYEDAADAYFEDIAPGESVTFAMAYVIDEFERIDVDVYATGDYDNYVGAYYTYNGR